MPITNINLITAKTLWVFPNLSVNENKTNVIKYQVVFLSNTLISYFRKPALDQDWNSMSGNHLSFNSVPLHEGCYCGMYTLLNTLFLLGDHLTSLCLLTQQQFLYYLV